MTEGADGLMSGAVKVNDGAAADREKQEKKLEQDAYDAKIERIGMAAEAFNRYHKAYGTDHHLEPEELIAGIHLELLNCREFYPKELGGKATFDAICDETHKWFEENKDK